MTPQAKPQDTEWCSRCQAWKRHDSAGDCYGCGRKLFRESTSDMIATLEAAGYIATQ